MDRGTVYDRDLYRLAFETAEKNNIPCQTKTLVAGGNDAAAIHKAAGGIKTVAVSVPCRYIHSPSCVAKQADIEARQCSHSALPKRFVMLKRLERIANDTAGRLAGLFPSDLPAALAAAGCDPIETESVWVQEKESGAKTAFCVLQKNGRASLAAEADADTEELRAFLCASVHARYRRRSGFLRRSACRHKRAVT